MTKIAVTGVGIITSLGVGKQANLQKLMAGESAIGAIRQLQTKHHDLPAGEVPYSDNELKQMLGLEASVLITRSSLLGRVALREALDEAGIRNGCPARVAFISGNTVGGTEKTELFYQDLVQNKYPNAYIELHDCGASTHSITQEYQGNFQIVTTISTACSSAANAVVLGANLIREGRVDIAVVGGTECLSKYHLNGFNSLMILDQHSCRPFDAERHGLNLGEGAAYIVLESEECAHQRAARALCELSGYGNACDAFHQTATSPNGEGAYLAMKEALMMGGLQPENISYINAHGTGTGNNDECEGLAMARIFGQKMPPVSSTKSYTGHTTSAAGGVESVFSILALLHDFIPANLGYEHPMEQHNFQPVTHVQQNIQLTHVMTNSFGFGGNNTSCIFSRLGTANSFGGSIAKPIFIQKAAQISIQQPLDDQWFEQPIIPNQSFNDVIDPDYKSYFASLVARRMGKLLKRAVVTAVNALGDHPLPDAIITGTGLGCIDHSERFLKAILENDEMFLQPTFFMLSTHNTISSQIALHLHCHSYNSTYSHRGTSFDSALLDAFSQMQLGTLRSALVGAHDELTPTVFNCLDKTGLPPAGCSVNMLLSTEKEESALCALTGMEMLYRPTTDDLRAALQRLMQLAGITTKELSAVVTCLNGKQDNDLICNEFIHILPAQLPIVHYKHLFGESFSASAFGVYVGAICLHQQQIPAHLLYNRTEPILNPRYLLIHNHFQNLDHSLTLLTIC